MSLYNIPQDIQVSFLLLDVSDVMKWSSNWEIRILMSVQLFTRMFPMDPRG